MLSFELVKVFHILSAFVLIAFACFNLLGKANKATQAAFGLGGLATVLGGFFLIGIMRGGMPMWVLAKLLIWVAMMAMVGIVNKRFPKYKAKAVVALFILTTFAVYLAVYKPY